MADRLVSEGRFAEAVPRYERLVEAFPEEDSPLLALAWAHHDSGGIAEAVACFERLFRRELARKPFAGFAYDELVRLYRETGNLQGLLSVCERAVAAEPADEGLLRTLGLACLAAGCGGRARDVFQRLVDADPEAPENWCSLGDARLAAGEPDLAADAYERAAAIDREVAPQLLRRLADRLLQAGEAARAKAVRERLLARHPDEPLDWAGLGDALACLEDPEAAIAAYARAVGLRPQDAGGLWHRLGRRLAERGLHDCAAAAFSKAVAAAPENRFCRLSLAKSLAARGRNDVAAAVLGEDPESCAAANAAPADGPVSPSPSSAALRERGGRRPGARRSPAG